RHRPPLPEVTALMPETPQPAGRQQTLLDLPGGERPAQRRPDVVVLGLEEVEPALGLPPDELRLRLPGPLRDDREQAVLACLELAGLGEALEAVLPDDLEHAEARFLVARVGAPDEALVDERAVGLEHVDTERPIRVAAGLRVLEPPAAGEHREPPEVRLLERVQEVVAPGDRATECLLPLRQVSRAAREEAERLLQAAGDRGRAEEADPGRRQLDCQ